MSDFKKLWKHKKWFYIVLTTILCIYSLKSMYFGINHKQTKELLESFALHGFEIRDLLNLEGRLFGDISFTFYNIHITCCKIALSF